MINVLQKEQCCGCDACTQICPQKCISMKTDSEGFSYPIADKSVCIECGLCEKVCPVKNAKKCNETTVGTYIAYAKNEPMRLKSSSGGLFSLFAQNVLKSNGVVFGAAFDKELMVHHIKVEDEKELKLLRGSKYLQSRIENTYIEAKLELQKGRKVLYTGTACQIAGLKNFLKRDYDNLYTIDILCHGVPSPKLWKFYLNSQQNIYSADITDVSFRSKDFGWKAFAMELNFNNLSKYKKPFTQDPFMDLFLSNICLRPSCHSCKFKALERPSDITIGDCWGIEKYMPELDDDKGTSVILTHSHKGEEMFENIKDFLNYNSAETEQALPPSSDSRKSVAPHENRKIFFKALNSKSCTMKKLTKLLEPTFGSRAKSIITRGKNKLLRTFR